MTRWWWHGDEDDYGDADDADGDGDEGEHENGADHNGHEDDYFANYVSNQE